MKLFSIALLLAGSASLAHAATLDISLQPFSGPEIEKARKTPLALPISKAGGEIDQETEDMLKLTCTTEEFQESCGVIIESEGEMVGWAALLVNDSFRIQLTDLGLAPAYQDQLVEVVRGIGELVYDYGFVAYRIELRHTEVAQAGRMFFQQFGTIGHLSHRGWGQSADSFFEFGRMEGYILRIDYRAEERYGWTPEFIRDYVVDYVYFPGYEKQAHQVVDYLVADGASPRPEVVIPPRRLD